MSLKTSYLCDVCGGETSGSAVTLANGQVHVCGACNVDGVARLVRAIQAHPPKTCRCAMWQGQQQFNGGGG
ncbi:MAG: hypothetical protein LC640_09225 [Frankia sp.]|nr:hypothetical protein [Frankia sp.]